MLSSTNALALLLGISALPSVATLGALSSPLTCGPSGPLYSVSLDGSPLLTGAPPLAIFVDGALETSFSLETAQNVTGSDTLGAYSGTTCVYSRASSPTGAPFFIASVFNYATTQASPASSAVRFHYTFPGGASGTNFSAGGAKGAHFATISNFPAFTSAPLLPNSLTWQDSFFPSQLGNVAYGMAGGPLLSYAQDVAGLVTVLSPMDNFLTSSLGDWQAGGGTYCPSSASIGCWSAGTASTVTSLPPGFSHSWLLLAGAEGITDTMAAWGGVMRAYYGATSQSLTDPSLTGLGYQTDNGAQLCFGCPGQVLDACLLGEKGYLDSVGVPVQYLSFQNAWWKSGGESAPWCVGEWEAVPAKVPMGIPAFQRALDLPLQLYAPYFCATSSYPANFTMVRSDTSLPGCDSFDFYDAAPESSRLFYDFLFDLGQSYGMTMFEPDFLNQNHNCQPRFISEVGAAEGFFDGQASAALARGIPIQWCFCTPYLLMWTLNAPSITNFRVSYDFFYGGSWDIGTTSLLVMSLGKAPSKDTFWTTDNGAQATTRGGCDKKGCPPDHSTPAAELHTLLALMTTGPVGFSDAPNETDATLILRTCDSGGNLLQPSRPITAVDSTQQVQGGGGGGDAPKGYVLSTHTFVPGNLGVPGGAATAYFILAHQLTAPYTALVRDLWPPPARGLGASGSVTYAVAGSAKALRGEGGVCPPGATAASCSIALLSPLVEHGNASTTPLLTFPAVPQGVDPFTPNLAILAPLCPASGGGGGGGGVTFFGEVDKFATISTQRFLSLVCGTGGEVGVKMAGQGGEKVRVRWVKWAGGGGTVQEGTYTFAQGGGKGTKEVACTIPASGDSLTCGGQPGLVSGHPAPPPSPPCYNPLNYNLETICYNTTSSAGNVTVRSMGVGLTATLATGMSSSTTFAEGSQASAVPLFEYFLSDNGSFQKIPLTVPLIFRPDRAGTWLASFALPPSLFPTPNKAPEIISGTDLMLEPFADPQAPNAGRLVAAYLFYTIDVATEADYTAACKALDAALPSLGLVPVAGAWSEAWVTYSTKEMVGNMVNECWREVASS